MLNVGCKWLVENLQPRIILPTKLQILLAPIISIPQVRPIPYELGLGTIAQLTILNWRWTQRQPIGDDIVEGGALDCL